MIIVYLICGIGMTCGKSKCELHSKKLYFEKVDGAQTQIDVSFDKYFFQFFDITFNFQDYS